MSDVKIKGFGREVDELARQRGGWPDDVIVYALKVLGDCDAPDEYKFIEMTGDVPVSIKADGWPKWPRGKAAKPRTAIVPLRDYRAAILKAEGGQ